MWPVQDRVGWTFYVVILPVCILACVHPISAALSALSAHVFALQSDTAVSNNLRSLGVYHVYVRTNLLINSNEVDY